MQTQPEVAEIFDRANAIFAEREFNQAVQIYRQCLDVRPDFADAHNNLGNALLALGQIDDAIACYQRAIDLRPDFPEAHYNLGAGLQSAGRFDESAEAYRDALKLVSDLLAAQNNLGTVLQKIGRNADAIRHLRDAIAQHPDSPDLQNNLGTAFMRQADFTAAADCFRRAITLNSAFVEAQNNLGNALHNLGQPDQAIACYRAALGLRPDSAEIFNNLGNVLTETGQLDSAVACYDRALHLRPDYADACNNLANALKDSGRLDQAINFYDKAMAIDPSHVAAHSGKIYTLHFHPDSTPASLALAHQEWNLRHAASLPQFTGHRNSPDPTRRLRIGYVSADFRDHVIGRFLLPLFSHHSHEQLEIFCYASVARPDSLTAQFRHYADSWRDAWALSDSELATQIHDDQIDILVDLNLHMGGSRLLAFARRPAPVQMTYLGYCGTTGLTTMDYRITDSYLDLPGSEPNFYCEKPLRLPRSYWCYQPPEKTPDPVAPPVDSTGHITFGCLNNFCKISSPTIQTWGKLLRLIPESRLVLHAHQGSHRQKLLDHFATEQIAPDRIDFLSFVPLAGYFAAYAQIDIALDPFPYTGGTTTCDALWMDVPVVSLAGQTAVSRGGLSILSNIGLTELIAHSTADYIAIATNLAHDVSNLRHLRTNLRHRMCGSPLMDAAGFSREMGLLYRTAWSKWCSERVRA